jgi:zinc protease
LKKFILPFCAIILMAGCNKNQDTNTSVAQLKTPSGIPYTLVFMPDKSDIGLQIAWPTNWVLRTDVNQSVPYVGAQLILAGGAEGYAAGVAGETFADLKSEAYLSASPDYLYGELYFKKENLNETLDVANAHLRAPLFDKNWLGRIADGLNANIKEAAAAGNFLSIQTARWSLIGDQPLRQSLALDEPGIVSAVTIDDLKSWKNQTIGRTNALIAIAGDLTPEAAGVAIDKLMEGLPDIPPEKPIKPSLSYGPRTILLHRPDLKTSSLLFIAPLPPTKEGKELEDIIIVQALGGDDQSALFKAVRTDLRAAYGFGAAVDAYSRENRILALLGEVETGKLSAVHDAVLAAYKKLRSEGPEGDMEPRKSSLRARIDEGRENVSHMSYGALMANLDGQDPLMALKIGDLLTAVSIDSVKSRLKDAYPEVGQFVVVAVSPDPNAIPEACVIKLPQEAVNCK